MAIINSSNNSLVPPDKFAKICGNDPTILATITTAASTVAELASNTPPFFFPEYTDHSLNHIQVVLDTCSSLVAEHTLNKLSKADVETLICAVLVHDLGMHITDDVFHRIIHHDNVLEPIPSAHDKAIKDLWSEFSINSKFWSEKEKQKILGTGSLPFQTPEYKPEWTKIERLFVGEFLRKVHPQIAHQISKQGFPLVDGTYKQIFPFLDEERRDLVGWIARSHGMSLRKFKSLFREISPTIEPQVEYLGAHPTFLAVLLRISDYLHITSDRTNLSLSKTVRRLSSISNEEHAAHIAIKSVTESHNNSETIVVYAKPSDPKEYTKISNLLRSIQWELDQSWAVLGETYFQTNSIDPFCLRYRRIRSNIDYDDAQSLEFVDKWSYIPKLFSITNAPGEMLPLFVLPLYGEDPRAGIRELLQNSVDAIIERSALDREFAVKDGNVRISITTTINETVVEIVDNGVGMTLAQIEKHFLRVGSPKQKSGEWRKAILEKSGTESILRAGRFGIGSLAAFLLGEDVSVTTRSMYSADSHQFTYSIEGEQISINRITAPIGTTIRIKAERDVFERVADDRYRWFESALYYGVTPSVEVIINSEKVDVPVFVPVLENDFPGWHYVNISNNNRYWWIFDGSQQTFLNGLLIFNGQFEWNCGMLHRPTISVVDMQNDFPINLARESINLRQLPLVEELYRSIGRTITKAIRTACKHGWAQLLSCAYRQGILSGLKVIELDDEIKSSPFVIIGNSIAVLSEKYLEPKFQDYLCISVPEIKSLGSWIESFVAICRESGFERILFFEVPMNRSVSDIWDIDSFSSKSYALYGKSFSKLGEFEPLWCLYPDTAEPLLYLAFEGGGYSSPSPVGPNQNYLLDVSISEFYDAEEALVLGLLSKLENIFPGFQLILTFMSFRCSYRECGEGLLEELDRRYKIDMPSKDSLVPFMGISIDDFYRKD